MTLTEPNTTTPPAPPASPKKPINVGATATRYFAVIAFVVLCIYFGIASPAFATGSNLASTLSASALLAIVALAMTMVVRTGGIDLSVGVALDFGAMGAIYLINNGYTAWVGVVGGLVLGLLVGLANAAFIVVLRVSPFLATLSTMFIGQSIQNVVTEGGSPTYLLPASNPPEFQVMGKGQAFGLDVPVIVAAVALLVGWVVLERLRLGRMMTAVGVQTPVARIVGIPVRTVTGAAYVMSALTCALAGILLASRLGSFVPLSGSYYLLDAIGAVFIGTTLHKESLPNVLGTLVGVLIFGVLANGLNLVGLSFYWQGLARGLVLLLVLGLSVTLSRRRRRPVKPPTSAKPAVLAAG